MDYQNHDWYVFCDAGDVADWHGASGANAGLASIAVGGIRVGILADNKIIV